MKTHKTLTLTLMLVLAVLASSMAPAGRAAASSAPAGLAQQANPMGTVTAARLNVRSGPGISNSAIGQLKQGDRVEILSRQSGWLQIAYPSAASGKAWVSAAYVAVDGEAAPKPAASTTAAASGGSKAGGKLVFQNRNGGDIFIMNADGTGLRKLTTGFEPSLSPDGTQVAFTRFTEPMGLYLINADGTNEHRIYGANRPRSPTWAPDGKSIVIEWSPNSKSCYYLPIGCLTDEEWTAVAGDADCLQTPYGEICLSDYAKFNYYFTNLTSVDVASSASRDLPAGETAVAPNHNPQDDRVLYLDKEGLYTTRDVGNDAPQMVVKLPNLVGAAVYSANGQYIYGMRRLHDHWEVWRWNSDGGVATPLTTPAPLAPKPINNVAPAPSPDGSQVLFFTDRNGKWEMYVMNADGSNQRPFAPQALAGIAFQYDGNNERMVDWGQ